MACAALIHRFRTSSGVPLRYWKPIQTGIEQDDDTREVRSLSGCAENDVLDAGVRLAHAVSPHLAARWSGLPIDMKTIIETFTSQKGPARWIVEGAGGALVPINESTLMIDAMVALGLPVLIVSRSSLGTINHTLLTIEALRARSLTVSGVLMVGQPDAENRAAIETYGRVPVVGQRPPLAPLTANALAHWAATDLDCEGRLPL